MSAQPPIIAVLVGSLSQQSINRKLAHALAGLAGERAEFRNVRLDDLPVYNRDVDADFPPVYRRLKHDIETADAVLFVTPENNRSIPAVLKNALDIASRPWGKNAFAGKPGAMIGTSTGRAATALAQRHLRDICAFLDVSLMAQPEAYIGYHEGLIADDSSVTDAATRDFLMRFIDHYLQWIARFSA